MRISDWSSDVCSSDLPGAGGVGEQLMVVIDRRRQPEQRLEQPVDMRRHEQILPPHDMRDALRRIVQRHRELIARRRLLARENDVRSEEHTADLQSLMRLSYAVYCSKKHKTAYPCSQQQRAYGNH